MQRGPQGAGSFCRSPFPKWLALGPSHMRGKHRGWVGGVWAGALSHNSSNSQREQGQGPGLCTPVGKGLALEEQEEGRGQEVVHLGSGGPPRKENQFSTGLSFHVASRHPQLPSSIRKWEVCIPKLTQSPGTTCTSWTR